MAEGETGAEKSHEPTPQKLDDARRKGDVPKSTDLSAAASYVALLVALLAAGAAAVQGAGEAMLSFLARADTLAPRILGMGGGGLSLQAVMAVVGPLSPLFVAPFILVLATVVAQRAVVFAPGKLTPKLSKISLIEGAKKKFGVGGLAEFLKAVVKLAAISVVLAVFLAGERDLVIGLARAAPVHAAAEMGRLAIDLLTRIAVIAAAIAAVDYLWQRQRHTVKLRMTYQEVKEETKRNEGDPMIKSQRRRRAEEIAANRMMVAVPTADVVIVNPTHYAVALKWTRAMGGAPIVVAKGVDGVALRIREAAETAGVPIHSDPPTARALEATADIGREIDPTHYQAVAAAIRFSEAMRAKMRERGA